MKPVVICLMGHTASGKTFHAVELAQQFPFEIISVDSSLIYRGMDIGTAKPDKKTLAIAPHRLIDIRDPAETYSVGQFCEDATREIEDIFSKGKTPLLVGGTMMYFYALQQGLSKLPEANLAIRETIYQEAEKIGWDQMHAKLFAIDPTAAKRIHPHDTQRISRALEIYETTHQPWTHFIEQHKNDLPYSFINLGLWIDDRQVLRERITKRFGEMLENGFIEEVEKLSKRPDLSESTPSMRAVGYRQIWLYLKNQLTFQEMHEKAITATYQLAKRQRTWLRKFGNIEIFEKNHLTSKIFGQI